MKKKPGVFSSGTCLVCGKGQVEEVVIRTRAMHDGKPIKVVVPAERCSSCGEETIKASDLRDSTKQAIAVTKKCTGQVHIRMSAELHRELVELAEEQERSLNQQIVYLLKQAVESDGCAVDQGSTRRDNIIEGNFGKHPESMRDTKSRAKCRRVVK